MKKRLLLLLFFFSFLSGAFARNQEDTLKTQRKVVPYLGFELGYAKYILTGTEVDHRLNWGDMVSPREGTALGGVLKFEFYKYFYFKSGLQFIPKGGIITKNGGYPQKEFTVKYFSVPVIFGLTPIRTKELRLSIEGGLLLNSQINAVIPIGRLAADYMSNTNEALHSWAWGIELLYFLSPKSSIYVNFRNSRDADYFYARIYIPEKTVYDFRNRGFNLTAGLLFNLSKK